jgi:hypothetical protein
MCPAPLSESHQLFPSYVLVLKGADTTRRCIEPQLSFRRPQAIDGHWASVFERETIDLKEIHEMMGDIKVDVLGGTLIGPGCYRDTVRIGIYA